MQTNTKYFGAVTYEEEDVLTFQQGLFGFEEERSFLLLPFAGSDGNLLCFQSLQTPSLAFVAMNPFSICPTYAPVLTAEELQQMQVERSEDLCYYVLCVVRQPVGASTVNLRCPVVVNEDTHQAIQTILESDCYGMRHRLDELSDGGCS